MTLLASAGLISLFVIFTFLDQMSDIEQDYNLIAVIKYVSYSIPRMFYETVPYAALIGSLTGLGILASNSELIIMRTAGISTWQIAIATMKPALAFVIAGLLVGELILPDFERTARASREKAMEGDITPDGGFWYREGNNAFVNSYSRFLWKSGFSWTRQPRNHGASIFERIVIKARRHIFSVAS